MAGLEPEGVLELMAYSRFHRQGTTAHQKALRLLAERASWLCLYLRHKIVHRHTGLAHQVSHAFTRSRCTEQPASTGLPSSGRSGTSHSGKG